MRTSRFPTSRNRILLTFIVALTVGFAGCLGGEDAPSTTDTTTPPPGGSGTSGGTGTGGSGGDDNATSEPPAPTGTPVNDTQVMTIQGAGPSGGGTPIASTAYAVTPGFTSFTVDLKWFETSPAQETSGLGTVVVDVVDADGNVVGGPVSLAGPAQAPATATMSIASVPAAGDYQLRVTPQDPAARGSLQYMIQVAY